MTHQASQPGASQAGPRGAGWGRSHASAQALLLASAGVSGERAGPSRRGPSLPLGVLLRHEGAQRSRATRQVPTMYPRVPAATWARPSRVPVLQGARPPLTPARRWRLCPSTAAPSASHWPAKPPPACTLPSSEGSVTAFVRGPKSPPRGPLAKPDAGVPLGPARPRPACTRSPEESGALWPGSRPSRLPLGAPGGTSQQHALSTFQRLRLASLSLDVGEVGMGRVTSWHCGLGCAVFVNKCAS